MRIACYTLATGQLSLCPPDIAAVTKPMLGGKPNTTQPVNFQACNIDIGLSGVFVV